MALERNACVSKLSVALSERELCLLGCEGRGNWLSVDISYLRICLFFGCFFCSLLSIKFQLEVSACPVFLLSAVCFFFRTVNLKYAQPTSPVGHFVKDYPTRRPSERCVPAIAPGRRVNRQSLGRPSKPTE